MFLRIAAIAAVVVTVSVGLDARESVRPIIERTGRWVEQFEQDFITVIADETYEQSTSYRSLPGLPRGWPSRRRLRSELLFMRGGDPPDWLAVRNVLSYTDLGGDTIEVPNSRDRLRRASAEGGREALRRLADESARFNIGRVLRNFNTPTLVVQFLDDAHRDRFKFTLRGAEVIGGMAAWHVAYEERDRPTMIKANGKNTDLSGEIWTRQSDGAVLRTKMHLISGPDGVLTGVTTIVTVEYARDDKLQMMVPARMNEEYVEHDSNQRIEGTATYSNYRVFETSGRLVTP